MMCTRSPTYLPKSAVNVRPWSIRLRPSEYVVTMTFAKMVVKCATKRGKGSIANG
ncbi:MAG: hypothetical protein OHK0023_10560 [Anaerolineae bacterium]